MRPTVGSLVIPARKPFHLDPVGSPSVEQRSFIWPENEVGILIQVDAELGTDTDPWCTIYVENKFGHCLLSEVKELQAKDDFTNLS
jgi:hypothetical protein